MGGCGHFFAGMLLWVDYHYLQLSKEPAVGSSLDLQLEYVSRAGGPGVEWLEPAQTAGLLLVGSGGGMNVGCSLNLGAKVWYVVR